VQTWQLWAAAAALSAAFNAVLIKVGVQGIDAGLATLFRTVTVAVVLALQLGPVAGGGDRQAQRGARRLARGGALG